METTEFTRDLTAEADSGLIQEPLGREDELNFILKALAQEGKSNVLITGPAGSGKTALVEGLAFQLINNKQYENYPRKKVIVMDLTALNSGAIYVGQFEERVTAFLNQVKSDPSTVVFIDEIHMLMGFGKAGDGSAARDFSQIIKPALSRGEICCIGATTQEEYEKFIASDGAFVRRFQNLLLQPLGREATIQVLKRAALKYKYNSGLDITDFTLNAIFNISEMLLPQRFQPDKSLDTIKKLVMMLDTELQDSTSKQHSIKEYIQLLNEELAAINNDNYSILQSIARSWLGVSINKSIVINLTDTEILSKINQSNG